MVICCACLKNVAEITAPRLSRCLFCRNSIIFLNHSTKNRYYCHLVIIIEEGGGTNMSFLESLLIAFFIIAIVFVVLCGLYLLLLLFSAVLGSATGSKKSGTGAGSSGR